MANTLPILYKFFRYSFVRSEGGAIAVSLLLSFPVLLGCIALVTEAAFLQVRQNRLQAAADAAVFAAVVTRNRGGSDVVRDNAARDAAASVFGSVPAVSVETFATDPNKLRVSLQAEVPLVLSQAFLNSGALTIRSSATVAVQPGAVATCLHALEEKQEKALYIVGNNPINLVNCNFHSNSTNTQGLYVEKATSAYCGSYRATRYYSKIKPVLTCSVDPLHSTTLPNPFASRTLAVPTTAQLPTRSVPRVISGTQTFNPGTYTATVDLSGTRDVVFNPGTYVFTNTFKITTSGRVTGNGVTLIHNPSSAIDVDLSKANFQLTAPTSGTFQDIVFWGTKDKMVKIFDFNASSSITGYLYHPNGTLQIDGNIFTSSGCARFLARYVWVTGNVRFTVNCPGIDLGLNLVE